MKSDTLKELVREAQTWPPEDQQELAEYGRSIEARRSGHYILADDERVGVADGRAQADRRAFVSDRVVAKTEKRRGL